MSCWESIGHGNTGLLFTRSRANKIRRCLNKATKTLLFRMFSILLYSFLLLLAWCPSACGHLQANCSSGMNVSNVHSGVIDINGTLSSNSILQLSCVLKLDKPGSFLRMKVKRNDKKKGEGITSLIEWSYLRWRGRSFVDLWFNENTKSLFLYWFNFLIILW